MSRPEERAPMGAATDPGSGARTPRLLYLDKSDVTRAGGGDPGLYMAAVAEALALHAHGQFVQPLKPYLRWRPDGHVADRIIAMPAYLGGSRPVAGLKWVGSKHDNPTRLGLERASALIVLNDPETHYPVAIMEASLISGMRTAAVTAIAARHLARDGFATVACVGCGPIGRMQLVTLLDRFPAVRTIRLFDVRQEAAERVASELAGRFDDRRYTIAHAAEEAVHAAEVVITCTVTDRPYLPFDWITPGAFLSNISLMDLHKDVFLKADKVVVDDWEQSNREGKVLHQVTQEGRFSREDLHAELGQIVIGARPGRETDNEIIVLNPMGLAIEDLACAQAIYLRALEGGIGTWLCLG
jgi:N-[(2S)-2-amino-2-carboxyethyl]-L-glutamate dehydrogenase